MKKLLILLFSMFVLSSPSVFADDISDFQIEGISIGDSLLDYMTKGEILKGIERNKYDHSYLSESLKYFEVYLFEEFPIYDVVSIYIKNNALSKYVTNSNEEYKVLGISGMIYYNEDYDNCIINRDEVVEELSNIYKNSNQEKIISKHPVWEEKLVEDEVYFSLVGGGSSEASCIKIEKNFKIQYNLKDYLQVTIYSPEIASEMSALEAELRETLKMVNAGSNELCGTAMKRKSQSQLKKKMCESVGTVN